MKTLSKKVALAIILFLSISSGFSQAYGEIRGIIKNEDLEPIPYATIKILQGGALVGGSETDEKGKYSCKPLNPGTYEMVIMHPEYRTQTINKITVNPSEATYVDYKLKTNSLDIVTVTAEPIDYTNTDVDVDMFHTISMSATELMQSASYSRGSVEGFLEFMTSEAVVSSDGETHVRGSRGNATGYFVDGVRTMEPGSIPGLSIENVSVFTGGVPAMYGDLTSGAVIITTKTYFSGLRDKNIRIAEAQEKAREAKAKKQAEEDEKKRLEEIEAEKALEKKKNG